MIYKTIERLKTGRIENVEQEGGKSLPEPPYVIVKEEPVRGVGTLYRVIVHMNPGDQWALRSYVRKDLDELLRDFTATSADGNTNTLLSLEEISGTILDNRDNTISMERVFQLPDLF